ncbi:MAG: lipid-A-disaccharide synthase [Microcoleaceae cyanobacterium]
MRILISTGEVSGDLQGALLVSALQRQAALLDIDLEIVALGGDRMAEAGATLLHQTTAIGSVGIWESLPYILPILGIQRQVRRYLQNHPPDRVVLIDYMGSNLPIGRSVRRQFPQVPIFYYIAPQEWVWSFGRNGTAQIIRITDRLLAIFPEEAKYFRDRGASVRWVGHPLVDRMQGAPQREQARQILGIQPEEIAVALLPASRQQEIQYLLPNLFKAAQQLQRQYSQLRFWIPLSLERFRAPIQQAVESYRLNATLVSRASDPQSVLNVLAAADLALTKSGTVNLELALLNVPQVVVYRVSPITAWIAKNLLQFSIPFMSPANLVTMEPIVPEFLQDQATPENIAATAAELLGNSKRRQQMLADYQRMQQALGEPGVCDRTAQEILKFSAGV